MTTDRLVFLDVETTGLDPSRHEVWEVALFTPGQGFSVLQRSPRLATAEPEALIVNGFYERRAQAAETRVRGYPSTVWLYDDERFARAVAVALSGATLAGIGPWFDSAFLEATLRRAGEARAWDHRLVDCKALAVGQARVMAEAEGDSETLKKLFPPFSTQVVADALGIDRGDSHTAFADVVTAVKFYESAMNIDLRLREFL